MGFFDQAKMAAEIMKGMSPSEIQDMMKHARDAKKTLDEQIQRAIREEILKQHLVSRGEVEEMITRALQNR